MEVRGEGVRGADEPKYGDGEKESKWKESIEVWLQGEGCMGAEQGKRCETKREPGDEKERQ